MYTPLYVKSNYSFLTSLVKIDELVKKCVDYKIYSVALTDVNMISTMYFYKACKANNIKPIIGLSTTYEDKEICLYAKNHKGYEYLIKVNLEKKIDIDYGNNVHFVGIIDKVLYYISDDTTYISLIDYKTGADRIDLEYLKYGLDIQLPIYLYLSTKLPFNNIKHCGFYLQKFNLKDNDYRLIGYSNSNKDILSIMDNNYDNSKIIKGLKTLKDGSFASYSNVLSCDEMDEIIKTTENIIDNVIKKIKDNEFMINPKVSKGTNISCEYCKFKDICFMNHNDEVELDGGDL